MFCGWLLAPKNPLSLLFGVGGPFVNGVVLFDGIAYPRSAGTWNGWLFGEKCEIGMVDGVVEALEEGWGVVSNFVIVRPAGTFADPLCLRRLLEGPWNPVGDACLDKFRGVGVAEAPLDTFCGMVKGPGVIGNCELD